MRSLHCLTVIAAALLVAGGCERHRGENAPPAAGDTQQAASNGLATLQKLVTAQNYKGLGFTSPGEVKSAALAPPLALYNIGLDRLKSYQAGQDPNTLLTPSSETIYPVTVGGQVRSSLTVVKKETGYTAAGFGNADIVQGLARYRTANTPDAFAVRIPAFSLYFLGNRAENRLMFTPVTEDNRFPFRIGVTLPAEDVLKAIAPAAQTYNGLPM